MFFLFPSRTAHRAQSLVHAVLLLALVGLVGLSATRAWAGANQLPRVADGEGLKVGKKSKFHGGFALPVGVDSNVFNETSSEGTRAGAYTYPTAWLGVGSRDVVGGVLQTPPERTSRLADYNIGLIAGFRQFLARDERIRSQPKFSIGAAVRLSILPGRRFEIRIDDDFFRGASPGNYESRGSDFNFNRIEHDGTLKFIGRPGGGRLSLALGYHNLYLRFGQGALNKSNRMRHGALHETKWRFLPKSALVFQYTFDWTFYTDCCVSPGLGRNEDSYAHRLLGGYRGQVAKKLAVEAMVGWGLGYYRDDENGPDFKSFIGNVGLSYFPSLRTSLSLTGSRQFQDSLFGNYFVDNGVQLSANHQFRWRMNAHAGLGIIGRRYFGLPEPGVETQDIVQYEGRGAAELQQRDTLFTLQAKIDQPLGRIFSVGLNYTLLLDSTEFQVSYSNGSVDDIGYIKHVAWLLAAVRI